MIRINKTQLMKDILQVILASFIVYIEYMIFLKQNSLFIELLNHPNIVQYIKKTMTENIYLFRWFYVFINIIFLWVIWRVISIVREDIEMAWFTILLIASLYFVIDPNPYILVWINILFFWWLFIWKYKFWLPSWEWESQSNTGWWETNSNDNNTYTDNSLSNAWWGVDNTWLWIDTINNIEWWLDSAWWSNSIFDLEDDWNQWWWIYDPEYQWYFVWDDMYYIWDLDNTILNALKFKLSSNNDL